MMFQILQLGFQTQIRDGLSQVGQVSLVTLQRVAQATEVSEVV